jgi:hypothetical protein
MWGVALGGHLGLGLGSLPGLVLGFLSLGLGLGSLLGYILGSLLGLLLALPLGWGGLYQCGGSTGWTPWSSTGIAAQSITWTWPWVITEFWTGITARFYTWVITWISACFTSWTGGRYQCFGLGLALVLGSQLGLLLGSSMSFALGPLLGLILGSSLRFALGSLLGLILGSVQHLGWIWCHRMVTHLAHNLDFCSYYHLDRRNVPIWGLHWVDTLVLVWHLCLVKHLGHHLLFKLNNLFLACFYLPLG